MLALIPKWQMTRLSILTVTVMRVESGRSLRKLTGSTVCFSLIKPLNWLAC